MLHSSRGEYKKTSLNALKKIPVTAQGTRTDRWKGIQHGELVQTIIKKIKELFGWVPLNQHYTVSPNGAAIIGTFDVGEQPKRKGGKPKPLMMQGLPKEQAAAQSIGFVHSNDSRTALTLAAGGRVMVCSNGIVTGQYMHKARHTKNLTIGEFLADALRIFAEKMKRGAEAIKPLTEFEMTERMHDTALLDLARDKRLNWRLLGDVEKSWRNAQNGQIDWVQDGDWGFKNTAWDWYNTVTYIAQKIPAPLQFPLLDGTFNALLKMLPKKMRPNLDDSLIIDSLPQEDETEE